MASSPLCPEPVMTIEATVVALLCLGTEGLTFNSYYDLPGDRARIPLPR